MRKIILIWTFVFLLSLEIIFASCCLDKDTGLCAGRDLDSCNGNIEFYGDVDSCYSSLGGSEISPCQKVSCILANGECSRMTRYRCEVFFDDWEGTVSTLTKEECLDYKNSENLVNCFVDDRCTKVKSSECRGNVVSSCSNCGGSVYRCDPNDNTKILEYNSCGVFSRISRDCGGDFCEIDSDGSPKCVNKDCIQSQKTNLDWFFPVEEFPIETEITSEVLGNAKTLSNGLKYRKNGESWCIVSATENGIDWKFYTKEEIRNGNIKMIDINRNPIPIGEVYKDDLIQKFKKYSAGQRHYKFTCQNGEIVRKVGGILREKDSICFQNDEFEYYMVVQDTSMDFGDNSERWAMCKPKNVAQTADAEKTYKKVRDFLVDGVAPSRFTPGITNDDLATGKAYLQQGKSYAVIVDNAKIAGKCKAKYPLSNDFFGESIMNLDYPESTCGTCGDGWTNVCDKNECYRKGDCTFDGGSLSVGEGIAVGCVAGAAAANGIQWGIEHIPHSVDASKTLSEKTLSGVGRYRSGLP